MLAPPELRELHPLGKSPIVEDGGKLYAESGAILEHLAESHGGAHLYPDEGEAKDRCRYWLHYGEASLMPLLFLRLVFDRLSAPPVPLVARPLMKTVAFAFDRAFLADQLRLHADFIDAELVESTWFAGDALSLADFQMSFPLQAAVTRVPVLADKSNVSRFLGQVRERPAYQRALERGGPYAYA